ncbi:sensor histidine kinase [Aliagarivorans taiwanensis]|uniref:sensor histidine kinase n=1 Tax=Aliagarivorans taiwanensis TaxID=561966 RepID=UPI000421D84C|nr:ATP-binding protein [Aliagarivorans taiwanensis]
MPQCSQDSSTADLQHTDLSQIFEVMPSGLILLDYRGFVTKANKVAKSLLGEPLEGQRWIDLIPSRFSPQADDGHELSLANGRKVKLEISPLADSRGQLIVLTDLTETRALQNNVAKLQRLSALGKMVASLAHQIRTPLSAAILYGSNLANRTLAEPARSSFQGKLMDRLNDLEAQVNDMLLFARSGSELQLTDFSVDDLLVRLERAMEAAANTRRVNLKVIMPEEEATILANPHSLVSALCNIVDNAIAASQPQQQILIHAHCNDSQLNVSIEDQAGGIAEADLPRIFEPFYTKKQNGTGLGLAVVKTVTQAHNGRVTATNTGKGVRFDVQLPLKEVSPRLTAVGEQ